MLLSNLLALCIGVVMTLCVCGYQFGKSNHTVYLLDATHRSYPNLLANDWFTTETFQYHATYGFITRLLMRAHILETGFLIGYLGLVIAFHIAWMKLVEALGGTTRTYLVSVLFYYLSAGGTGLGIYQFFQDSCFLPSNISNVALLWAFYLWIVDRRVWSAVCFGVAGLFHLNYAIVGVGAWCALNAWEWIGPSIALPAMQQKMQLLVTRIDPKERSRHRRYAVRCWVAALVPSMFNIFMGAMLELHRGGKMPLAQFLDIYVKFRHPHHYYPRSWPLALWVCFLWPIPFAFFAWRILQQKMDLPHSKRTPRSGAHLRADGGAANRRVDRRGHFLFQRNARADEFVSLQHLREPVCLHRCGDSGLRLHAHHRSFGPGDFDRADSGDRCHTVVDALRPARRRAAH